MSYQCQILTNESIAKEFHREICSYPKHLQQNRWVRLNRLVKDWAEFKQLYPVALEILLYIGFFVAFAAKLLMIILWTLLLIVMLLFNIICFLNCSLYLLYVFYKCKKSLIFLFLFVLAYFRVRIDIINSLKLKDPYVTIASFDRKNLFYGVKFINRGQSFVDELVQEILKSVASAGSIIVYCTTIKDVEQVLLLPTPLSFVLYKPFCLLFTCPVEI